MTFSGCATTMINNPVLAERFRANMAAYGIVDQGDDPNAGSTDMANVSWVCPTIHPDLAICDEGVAGHSILFRDAAAMPRADETTLLGRGPRRPDRARPVRRSGARRGGLGGVPRRDRTARPGRTGWTAETARHRCYHPAARPAGRWDCEPAAPRRVTVGHGTREGM